MKRNLKFSGRFALTSVAAAMLALAAPWASALGLGRLSVQSALGEAMQAEIEVTSMTADEQANLKIRVAPPEAYRAANVDYNPVLPTTRATLQKRADGRLFVRLVSDRGVQEPFVDVILEISWATGRLVREYTLLFDPPASVRAAAAPAAPATTTSPVMSASPAAPMTLPPSQSPATSAREARDAAREAARQAARERREAARSASTDSRPSDDAAQGARAAGVGADEYRVRSGDTLSKIAARTQRGGVSLDQMLVSLFRANPSAFSGDNMNRLKAGVVLSVPSADSTQSVGAADARKTIVAQSADFGAYRQKLAASTLTPKAEPSTRTAGGKVQASVEDRKTATAAPPDKLTLSKGSASAKPGSPEDRLAKERERQAAEARVAELNKNLNDLKKIQGAAPAAPLAPPVVAPAASVRPTAPAPAPVVVAAAPPPPTPAPAPAPAPMPTVVPASAPAPAAPASVSAAIGAAPVVTASSGAYWSDAQTMRRFFASIASQMIRANEIGSPMRLGKSNRKNARMRGRNPDAPPYGVRLRLKSNFDETPYNANARVILRALKKYGMILSDGGNIALTFADDRLSTAKWSTLNITAQTFNTIGVNQFDVVDLGAEIPLTYNCVRAP